MTQLEYAKKNIVTGLMRKIASREGMPSAKLCRLIAEGKAVIPLNKKHKISKPCAIGSGLATKINANIGTSTDESRLEDEIKKLKVALKYGADAIMDLSVGGDLEKVRREVLKVSTVPVGTVPVYEISVRAQKKYNDFIRFDAQDMLEVLECQARQGVDFFTIHSGVNRESLGALKKHKRLMGVVSRGGAITANWMASHGKDNLFYVHFDEILEIAAKYDVTLSLGDGLRPGSILDATDKAQITELKNLGKLAARARARGVQVMIEGPGHVPLDQIKKNILLEKRYCQGAPFYVLGPLVTDIAPGYDHITSAIGGALAASYGADFLCYVTPAEHLRHPDSSDVREGVIASRIAAHAGDLVKRRPAAIGWDKDISEARKAKDWKRQIALSIDPEKARDYRLSSKPSLSDVCTMCGRYCSIKLMEGCDKK
ncbi:MAG: phosphomethylpyrimidine synthase ThiC [Candidatus Omnitrophica bacterium]|jgi:phosphomethylpyrimidine synthase|nr:phosphomethylpyrimidine synthase ThiC [Candidatus Omnitrophota bacterium]MDD3274317.1 phosphomethylpyrimidine synthase ThiC [Candidatus Omnitrophota bacterium]MDD5077383.1 phosphomethylpyrimidine synthase ThiC [Candidatus Omnitrophota bacterium]